MAPSPQVITSEKARLDYIKDLKDQGYNAGSEWGTGNVLYRDPRTGGLVSGFKDPGKRATGNERQNFLNQMSAYEGSPRYGKIRPNSTGGTLGFSGVKHQYSDNGNAILTGGNATMNINGQSMDVPNMLAQSLQFRDKVNLGRFNMSDILGRRKNLGHMDHGVLKKQFELMKQQRPDLYNEKNVMSKRDADYRAKGLHDKIRKQKAKMSNTVQRETAGVGVGQGKAKWDAPTQAMYKKLGGLRRELGRVNKAGKSFGRGGGDKAAGAARQLETMLKGYKPAESNLQIKETLVKYGDDKKKGLMGIRL